MDEGQLTILARQQASRAIDLASAALIGAAEKIAKHFGVPDGIAGLTKAESLGRMTFVQSMGREVRSATEQEIAKNVLKAQIPAPQYEAPPPPEIYGDGPVATPLQDPLYEPPAPTAPVVHEPVDTLDLGELPGVPVTISKALKGGGYNQVKDVIGVPDEHLLAVNGIAAASLAKLKGAVATYMAGGAQQA